MPTTPCRDRLTPKSVSGKAPTPTNRLGFDYRVEAERLGAPVVPMIDAHCHINGASATAVFQDVCDLFGVERVWSMTRLEDVAVVKRVMGERARFIAVPNWMSKDKKHAFEQGYLDDIRAYHDHGAKIVKFWAAPRARDLGKELGDPDALSLENPWRIRAMELASDLGMFFMAHIADPDTWFQTKYSDASFYGTKAQQYESLERVVGRFTQPWIIAHAGGWPEDLEFLNGMLGRHENIYLDTSATKWMIREISTHPRADVLTFFERWNGRLLFGSDIVTTDEHFKSEHQDRGMGHLASSAEEAFELYASRYWALRAMWETGYEGESNIADPDLMMVDPEAHDEMSAPALSGRCLPEGLLRVFYREAAAGLMDEWVAKHP